MRAHISPNTIAKRFANAFLVPHYAGLLRHCVKVGHFLNCLQNLLKSLEKKIVKKITLEKEKSQPKNVKTAFAQVSHSGPTVLCLVEFGIFL